MPASRKRKTPAAAVLLEHSAPPQSISQHFAAKKRATEPAPTTKPQPADYVQVGTHKLRVGQRLLPLVDSTALFLSGDWHALFRRLDEDGVILVRGVIQPETIGRARTAILQHIAQKGALHQAKTAASADAGGRALISRAEDGTLTAGWTIDADSGGVNGDRESEAATAGWRALGTSATLTDVYNGAELKHFLHQLFSAASAQRQQQSPLYRPSGGRAEVATTFPDCTWLRIRGHKDLTVEHTDFYYFKQERSIFSDYWQPALAAAQPPATPPPATCTLCSTTNTAASGPTLQCALCQHSFHRSCLQPTPPLRPRGGYYCPTCANLPFPFYTCWIALGSVHRQHGRLALVPGTHRLSGYEERQRGGGDGKLPRGWRGEAERSAVWRSSDMEAGDLLLFNVKTVHGASVNTSDEFRISMDTRVTFAERRVQGAASGAAAEEAKGGKHKSKAGLRAENGAEEVGKACVAEHERTQQQLAERAARRETRGRRRSGV